MNNKGFKISYVDCDDYQKAILYRAKKYLNNYDLENFFLDSPEEVSSLDRPQVGYDPEKYINVFIGNKDINTNIIVTRHPISAPTRISLFPERNAALVSIKDLFNSNSLGNVIALIYAALLRITEKNNLSNTKYHKDCLLFPTFNFTLPNTICTDCREKLEFGGILSVINTAKIFQDNVQLDNGHHVILTHGIRTHAHWISPLKNLLEEYGFSVSVAKYGWFSTIRFVFRRYFLSSMLEKIQSAIKEVELSKPGHNLSIIAHSNGTYLVSEMLKKYPEYKFDRLILAGSIIDRDFNWNDYINSGQVKRVLTDCGNNDIFPTIANNWIPEAGSSGTYGFLAENHNIINLKTEGFWHSSMLKNREHQIKNWIPFLYDDNSRHHSTSNEPSFMVKTLSIASMKRVSLALALIVVAIYFL